MAGVYIDTFMYESLTTVNVNVVRTLSPMFNGLKHSSVPVNLLLLPLDDLIVPNVSQILPSPPTAAPSSSLVWLYFTGAQC